MESKNKFWKGILVGSLVTAFSALIIVGISAGVFLVGSTIIKGYEDFTIAGSSSESASRLDMEQVMDKIEFINREINREYLFDIDYKQMEEAIYAGVLNGLGDPYSVYYTEEELSQLLEETTGVYSGIGVMVTQDPKTGVIRTVKVFEGTPGYEAGVLPGDVLFAVDGVEVSGIDLDLVVKNHIKGLEGTPVTITVMRPESDELIDLTMERRSIEVSSVESKMIGEEIGYVLVSQFDELTTDQFILAIETLQEQGMKKMIVDLRNNPGGVLDSVVRMLDYLLPEGMLVYTSDKNGEGDKYYSDEETQLKIPLVVLVNGNSASASEVFAGAIKDYEWGTIIGEKTYGKGIVQQIYGMTDGTAIKLTVSHYYTPSGFDLHGKGIEPDIVVELEESLKTKLDISEEEDSQLQAAITYLQEQ